MYASSIIITCDHAGGCDKGMDWDDDNELKSWNMFHHELNYLN
jgi:hypothetical protein